MSGILDVKQRILDTLVTLSGRKQMANGKFRIEFVTFSDGATFYKPDVVSGSDDATGRLFLEACNLPQDFITFEADDSGRLVPFPNTTPFDVTAGKIFSGSSVDLQFVTGSDFASTADTLLGSSIDNFKKLYSLGTIDTVFEDDEFLVSSNELTFILTDENPFNDPALQSVNITALESLFADKRLSNIPNFKYLPPINKVTNSEADLFSEQTQRQFKMATYTPLGPVKTLNFEMDVLPEVKKAALKGNVKVITFDPTTNQNNIALQIFEMRSDTLLKLDIIEFGKFRTDNPTKPDRHVFFAGKMFLDDNESHTFVRLFTIIFE